ncbi:hypothetical protein J1N10_03305 [Carboxylicivirga sp. A043]|uniref:hypothetical protein n=1 Tax=Carboxylicivirga litoralis TaxID=2816963 RepID=UPI0021CAF600|nr:hypothetical protein [Carboxylicivirga sp. A043]MCU4154988.1 hypothetical protein [Carboxylicivirga sp. A043]
MTITKTLFALFTITAIVSCFQSKTKESNNTDKLTYLNGYFLRNNVSLNEEVNPIVITSKNEFDNYFGIAKTMNNTVSEVEFDKNNYAAIITKPSSTKQMVIITNSKEENGQLTINYKILKEGNQTFVSNEMKIFAMPKTIKSVNFVSERESKLIEIN